MLFKRFRSRFPPHKGGPPHLQLREHYRLLVASAEAA